MSLNNEYLRLNLYKQNADFETGLEIKSPVFAYDLDQDIFSVGQVTNEEALAVSIQNILMTLIGQVIFELQIGTNLGATVFENFNESLAETFLSELITSIEAQDNRLEVIRSESSIAVFRESNSIDLKIGFVAIDTGTFGLFERTITI